MKLQLANLFRDAGGWGQHRKPDWVFGCGAFFWILATLAAIIGGWLLHHFYPCGG